MLHNGVVRSWQTTIAAVLREVLLLAVIAVCAGCTICINHKLALAIVALAAPDTPWERLRLARLAAARNTLQVKFVLIYKIIQYMSYSHVAIRINASQLCLLCSAEHTSHRGRCAPQ
jgi:hypothetical protein